MKLFGNLKNQSFPESLINVAFLHGFKNLRRVNRSLRVLDFTSDLKGYEVQSQTLKDTDRDQQITSVFTECLDSSEKNGGGYDVVNIDQENSIEYIPEALKLVKNKGLLMVTFNDSEVWKSEGSEFLKKYGSENLLLKNQFSGKVFIDIEITARILLKKLTKICNENMMALN